MLIDTRSLPDGEIIETDVVIVGAGLAGISLAREFIGKKFNVCLLESGGLQPDKKTQSLYYGENIGRPYFDLDTARGRYFGGSSHYWLCPMGNQRTGVRLRAMDAFDFEKKDWVPNSGWPFPKSHLDPYYEKAHKICRIGKYSYTAEDWQDPVSAPILPLDASQIETTVFHFGQRKYFFEDYREEIDKAANIRIYLYANVLEIESETNAKHVKAVHVRTLNGNQCRIQGRIFVLALGGIETPRLLLLSNRVQKEGLGNQHDLVGRFFMEHPHLPSGFFIPENPEIAKKWGLYAVRSVDDFAVMGKLAITEKVQRRDKILNYCVALIPQLLSYECTHKLSVSEKAAATLFSSLRHRKIPPHLSRDILSMIKEPDGAAKVIQRKIKKRLGNPDQFLGFRLNQMSEQAPNPDSRVTLSDELDFLGQRRVRLNWQISDIDMRTIVRSQQIIDSEMRRAGLGSVNIELEGQKVPPNLCGGWHHMGTTRMHDNPLHGVVDQNCKVHNISNLYIAGSSVFPTVGYANPVLTTIALVLKLADLMLDELEQ